jgi:hypothetical protein
MPAKRFCGPLSQRVRKPFLSSYPVNRNNVFCTRTAIYSRTLASGTALIANNVISETRRGAIVGMARSKPVTGDLSVGGTEQYAHIALSGNRVH